MKNIFLRLLPAFFAAVILNFAACAAATSPAPATTPAADVGRLEIYDFMTQNGTIARRTFLDGAGRVSKEIYYTMFSARRSASGTPPEEMAIGSQVLYHYENGRLVSTEAFDGAMKPQGSQHYEYGPDGEVIREWSLRADGTKEFETRRAAQPTPSRFPSIRGRALTELYFDATGTRLLNLRGELPADIDLPQGWGSSAANLACGIVLSRERGRPEQIQVHVSLKNTDAPRLPAVGGGSGGFGGTVPAPLVPPLNNDAMGAAEFILRDARGSQVAERTLLPDKEAHYVYLRNADLRPGTAGVISPEYELASRFPSLAPGRYTLRLRLTVPGRAASVLSNEVVLTVE